MNETRRPPRRPATNTTPTVKCRRRGGGEGCAKLLARERGEPA
jgi:hypothetical protein